MRMQECARGVTWVKKTAKGVCEKHCVTQGRCTEVHEKCQNGYVKTHEWPAGYERREAAGVQMGETYPVTSDLPCWLPLWLSGETGTEGCKY